jgi:hypothetical protein
MQSASRQVSAQPLYASSATACRGDSPAMQPQIHAASVRQVASQSIASEQLCAPAGVTPRHDDANQHDAKRLQSPAACERQPDSVTFRAQSASHDVEPSRQLASSLQPAVHVSADGVAAGGVAPGGVAVGGVAPGDGTVADGAAGRAVAGGGAAAERGGLAGAGRLGPAGSDCLMLAARSASGLRSGVPPARRRVVAAGLVGAGGDDRDGVVGDAVATAGLDGTEGDCVDGGDPGAAGVAGIDAAAGGDAGAAGIAGTDVVGGGDGGAGTSLARLATATTTAPSATAPSAPRTRPYRRRGGAIDVSTVRATVAIVPVVGAGPVPGCRPGAAPAAGASGNAPASAGVATNGVSTPAARPYAPAGGVAGGA